MGRDSADPTTEIKKKFYLQMQQDVNVNHFYQKIDAQVISEHFGIVYFLSLLLEEKNWNLKYGSSLRGQKSRKTKILILRSF